MFGTSGIVSKSSKMGRNERKTEEGEKERRKEREEGRRGREVTKEGRTKRSKYKKLDKRSKEEEKQRRSEKREEGREITTYSAPVTMFEHGAVRSENAGFPVMDRHLLGEFCVHAHVVLGRGKEPPAV